MFATFALIAAGAALAGPAGCRDLFADDPRLLARCERTLRRAHDRGVSTLDLDAAVRPAAPVTTGDVELAERVTTLNLGLLYIGLAGGYSVPMAEARRAAMPELLGAYLDSARPAVMVFQECYLPEDRALIEEIGAGSGYVAVDERPGERARTGLFALVRGDLTLEDQGYEPLPGDLFDVAGYRRGVLWVRVRRADGRRLVVTNVHLTPLQSRLWSWPRSAQTVELRALLDARAAPFGCLDEPNPCGVVMAGDFNLAPSWDFATARVVSSGADREDLERWLRWDARLYLVLAGVTSEAEVHGAGIYTLDPTNPTWDGYTLNETLPAMRPDLGFVTGAAEVVAARRVLDGPDVPGGYAVSDHAGLELQVVLR